MQIHILNAFNETFHNILATLEVETHETFVLVPALLTHLERREADLDSKSRELLQVKT